MPVIKNQDINIKQSNFKFAGNPGAIACMYNHLGLLHDFWSPGLKSPEIFPTPPPYQISPAAHPPLPSPNKNIILGKGGGCC